MNCRFDMGRMGLYVTTVGDLTWGEWDLLHVTIMGDLTWGEMGLYVTTMGDLTWGEWDCTLPPWAIWHGANGAVRYHHGRFDMGQNEAVCSYLYGRFDRGRNGTVCYHHGRFDRGRNGTVCYHHGRFDMGRNGTVCYHHGRFAMGRNGTVCYHHGRFDMGRKGKGQKGTSPEEREFGTREHGNQKTRWASALILTNKCIIRFILRPFSR